MRWKRQKLSVIALCILASVSAYAAYDLWLGRAIECRAQVWRAQLTDVTQRLEQWATETVFAAPLQTGDVMRAHGFAGSEWAYVRHSFPDHLFWVVDKSKAMVGLIGLELPQAQQTPFVVSVTDSWLNGYVVKKADAPDFDIGGIGPYVTPVSENVGMVCLPPRF